MNTATVNILRPAQADALLAQLERRQLLDREEGDVPFTLIRVDDAIQSAIETWALNAGVLGELPAFDYMSREWDWIIDDVAGYLGLDYDEIIEVAP